MSAPTARAAAAVTTVTAALLLGTAVPRTFAGDALAGRHSGALGATIRYTSPGSDVDHAPNRPDGSQETPRSRQRLQSGHVALHWRMGNNLTLSVMADHDRIVTQRDAISVSGAGLQLDWRLTDPSRQWHGVTTFRFSGHGSDAFERTSWVALDSATLTASRVEQPYDLQAVAEATLARRLPGGWRIGAAASAGLIRVGHGALSAQGRDAEGCRYSLDSAVDGGSLTLQQPCGDVQAFSQTWSDERTLDDRFAIAPDQDLNWTGRWVGLGAHAHWRVGRAQTSASLRWQRIHRDGIDKRIEAAGERALRQSASLSATAAYELTPALSIGIGLDWHWRPWLVERPLLYNRFTAARQDRRALLFHLGVKLRLR